jgi:rare lipoprotein A
LPPRPSSRPAILAGALSLVAGGATAQPSAARSGPQGSPPVASAAGVGFEKRRLQVRAGRRVVVAGSVRPAAAGLIAVLQVRRGGRWVSLDRGRTGAAGRYVLRKRVRRPQSARVRVAVRTAGGVLRRPAGRLDAYRWAHASWYGPGLYGNHLGCGGRLTPSTVGVAHRTLPCGTRLSVRHRGRTVRVRVIDRGPFVAGREYDLTAATARRLRFHGHGAILTTR